VISSKEVKVNRNQGGTKVPAAVAALHLALKDRDGSVRASAAEALKKIEPEAAKKTAP
jgi:HEAT repeat protein